MKKINGDIEQICAYCDHAVLIRESEVCICRHIGAVSVSDSCKRFVLDPLKLSPMPKKLPDGETVCFEI